MFNRLSEAEVVGLIFGAFFALVWMVWYWETLGVAPRFPRRQVRWVLRAAPLVCAALLFAVLKCLSAHDVRNDPLYIFFYMVLGAGWVGLFGNVLSWFGLSVRDDVLERGNQAAAWAIAGALAGLTLCFAGANIGDGPGFWVVLFAAWLATASLLLLWRLLDRLTNLADTVTIDRDLAAGLRLAGFLVAAGLILGRAAAGNWESAGATVRDFCRQSWPALILLATAVALEWRLRPVTDRSTASVAQAGLAPALGYCAVGIGAVVWLGAW